jgi:hypothetical protein
MTSTSEHAPGDPTPETGHYEECNVFGTRSGKAVHLTEGEPLQRVSPSHIAPMSPPELSACCFMQQEQMRSGRATPWSAISGTSMSPSNTMLAVSLDPSDPHEQGGPNYNV